MKYGYIIGILTIMAVLACFHAPVTAAEPAAVDEATTHYNRGEIFLTSGNYQEAIVAFDQALASNTTMIELSDALLYTYRDKAFAQIQLGYYEDAIMTAETGLARYPKDEKLWNNKGYALFKLQRYQDALAAYDRAITLDNEYTKALINKGDTLARMERYQDAAAAYTTALSTDPGNPDAAAGLAAAEKAAGSAALLSMILLVVVAIVVAGGTFWYLKVYQSAGSQAPDMQKKRPGKK